jgi:HK97 family phage prohead protease
MNKPERRTINMELRIDAPEGQTKKIRGLAAVFNSISEDLGGFHEQIAPGAFKSAISGDIRALFNHDPNMVLGRTTSGTLRCSETDRGLEFECDLPDTTYAQDLAACIQRGDISQCSFGFSVDNGGDTWKRDDTGQWMRTIHVVSRLYDVSPVTYPAYTDTSCAMRSLEKARAEFEPPFDDTELRQLRFKLQTS